MMKHTLLELVKDTTARLTYVCDGKVYFEIKVGDTMYQLEIDSQDSDWRTIHIELEYKAITLMRWIRPGMTNGKLLQLN